MAIGSEFDQVLEAAQAGQEWAISALYKDLNPSVVRYLRANTREAGDDLASETWLAVAKSLGSFTGDEGSFRRWLFTIARRQLVGHWRTMERRKTHSVPSETFISFSSPDNPEETGIASISTEQAIAMVMNHLPQDQAEVILLRVIGGFDADEVAAIIGKRPGNVRVLSHRALRKLANISDREGVTK